MYMAKKHKKLKSAQVEKHFRNISEWKMSSKKTTLTKKISFPSFVSGLAFAAKIAVHAEVMGHHPVIELTQSGVKIKLTTDSVKGLTEYDFDLAKRIDNLKIT